MAKEAPKIKVIVVEDDEGIRQLVCDILDMTYFECIPAKDGRDALEFMEKNRNDRFLVFVDLMMPGMTGWEFLKRVSPLRKSARAHLVVMTGLHSSSGARLNQSTVEYLYRPTQRA